MEIMLTSFGLSDAAEESADLNIDYLARRLHHLGHYSDLTQDDLFYRMPPVSMRAVGRTFMPDYATLVLCDKILLDKLSFERLHEGSRPVYSAMAETLAVLQREGFVELVDFEGLLAQKSGLLERMLANDLRMVDLWVDPLKQSLEIWRSFLRRWDPALLKLQVAGAYHDVGSFRGLLHGLSLADMIDGAHHFPWSHEESVLDEALGSSRKRRMRKYRNVLRAVLSTYLSYVNANLVLSNALDVGFHDWADFLPFYRQEFLQVGRAKLEGEELTAASQALFSVSFPELAITDTRGLLKILTDRRVEDLRKLVNDAVAGKVTFDEEFARRVLAEVLRAERKTGRYRRIISYVTMLIEFIPGVDAIGKKALEETLGLTVESVVKRKYRWFYMLSDVAEESAS